MRQIIAEHEVVKQVNEKFYRALEAASLSAMSGLWLHTDWVKCVHPGWDLLVGWPQIRRSWEQIFSNPSGIRVTAEHVDVFIEGDFALVSCYENLALFLHSFEAPVFTRTTATNLFQRVGGEWKLIHHHASPVPKAPLVEEDEVTFPETIQ